MCATAIPGPYVSVTRRSCHRVHNTSTHARGSPGLKCTRRENTNDISALLVYATVSLSERIQEGKRGPEQTLHYQGGGGNIIDMHTIISGWRNHYRLLFTSTYYTVNSVHVRCGSKRPEHIV